LISIGPGLPRPMTSADVMAFAWPRAMQTAIRCLPYPYHAFTHVQRAYAVPAY